MFHYELAYTTLRLSTIVFLAMRLRLDVKITTVMNKYMHSSHLYHIFYHTIFNIFFFICEFDLKFR